MSSPSENIQLLAEVIKSIDSLKSLMTIILNSKTLDHSPAANLIASKHMEKYADILIQAQELLVQEVKTQSNIAKPIVDEKNQ